VEGVALVAHIRLTGPFVAGLLVVLACASSAQAAKVTLRVEGAADTLVPRTEVSTTGAPVNKDGSHSCDGNRLIGALEIGTAGQWTGPWFGGTINDYSVFTIKGETYDFSGTDFWSYALNNHDSFTGPCNTTLQDGDDIVYYPSRCEVGPPPDFFCTNPPVQLLGLQNVPAAASKGQAFSVKVVRFDGNGAATAEPGATVAGAGASATSGADGIATLALPSAGVATLKASKTGAVRTAGQDVCVHDGDDGTCGTKLPDGQTKPDGPQLQPVVVYRAPDPELAGIARRQTFAAGKGPRQLKGKVILGSEALLQVKLRLTRKVGKKCSYYSGSVEAFRPVKTCGTGYFFKVGDRADWSYLLPERLGKGRYTLDVAVSDRKNQRRVESVVFFVG
jgi:hypothetical protein